MLSISSTDLSWQADVEDKYNGPISYEMTVTKRGTEIELLAEKLTVHRGEYGSFNRDFVEFTNRGSNHSFYIHLEYCESKTLLIGTEDGIGNGGYKTPEMTLRVDLSSEFSTFMDECEAIAEKTSKNTLTKFYIELK